MVRKLCDKSIVCRELIRMDYSREDLCKDRIVEVLGEKINIVGRMKMENK